MSKAPKPSTGIPTSQRLIAPDSFRVGRLAALQPRMNVADVHDAVFQTEDPVILNNVTNLLRLWGQTRQDLPEDFHEHVQVIELSRQPMAVVAADSQRVVHEMMPVDDPWSGGEIDTEPWISEDLFDLITIKPLEFPGEPTTAAVFLIGQEVVLVCASCLGEGKSVCSNCGGGGRTSCNHCGGRTMIACSRCSGSGTVLRSGGQSLASCGACRGSGAIRCGQCDADGRLACGICVASGQVTCAPCAGNGNVRRRWKVHTRIDTQTQQRLVTPEDWPIAFQSLADDTGLVGKAQWEWPTRNEPCSELTAVFSTALLPIAQELIASAIGKAANADLTRERISGMRVRLSGTFLFRLTLDYKGEKGTVFIGGNSSRVFPQSLPSRDQSFLKSLKRFTRRAISTFDSELQVGPNAVYFEAVRGGTAHISDHRCTVFAASQGHRFQTVVTADGYQVVVGGRSHGLENSDVTVTFDIELSVNRYRETVLTTSHRLSPAHRELYPKALALGLHFCFGHITIIVDSITGESFFAITDRRPYDRTSAYDYGCILNEMAGDVRRLVKAHVLQ